VRFAWSDAAQASMRSCMADQEGMNAINAAVLALADDPAPSEAFIRGSYRRLHVGRYRVMYEIEADLITVVRVDRVS
jgi:mRNA interferase RelE/StbE